MQTFDFSLAPACLPNLKQNNIVSFFLFLLLCTLCVFFADWFLSCGWVNETDRTQHTITRLYRWPHTIQSPGCTSDHIQHTITRLYSVHVTTHNTITRLYKWPHTTQSPGCTLYKRPLTTQSPGCTRDHSQHNHLAVQETTHNTITRLYNRV